MSGLIPVDYARTYDARAWNQHVSERTGLSIAVVTVLEHHGAHRAKRAGLRFDVVTPRWNADGEPIGPDVQLTPEAAAFVAVAAVGVATALHDAELAVWGDGS